MRKNRLIALIGTLTMAAAGLAAVSAGVSSKKAEGVSADNVTDVTVYCLSDQNDWYKDQAGTSIHHWGGSASSTNWPGAIMENVEGNLWKATIKSDEQFMFVRTNKTGGTDWGAKTATLTFPTNGNNEYHITSVKWDGAESTGSWEYYGNTSYYLAGSQWDWSDISKMPKFQANGSSGEMVLNNLVVDEDGTTFKGYVYKEATKHATYNNPNQTNDDGGHPISGPRSGSKDDWHDPNYYISFDGQANGVINKAGTYNVYFTPSTGKFWLSVQKYDVTFNVNGATTGSNSTVTGFIAQDFTTRSSDGIEKDGYAFSGWNTKNDGTGTNYAADAVVDLGLSAGGSKTLYAKWVKVEDPTYTVLYHSNEGSDLTASQSVVVGQNFVTKAANTFTKPSGKKFKEWNTSSDGRGTSVAAGATTSSSTAKDGTYNLYAIWELNNPADGKHIAVYGAAHRESELMTWNETDNQWEGSITLAAGEEFKVANFTDENPDAWYANIISNDESAKTEAHNYQISGGGVGDSSPNLVCNVAGTYNVYMKNDTDFSIYIPYIHYDVTYTAGEGSGDDITDKVAVSMDNIVRTNSFTAPDSTKIFDYWLGSNGETYEPSDTFQLGQGGTITLTAQWRDKTIADGFYIEGTIGDKFVRIPGVLDTTNNQYIFANIELGEDDHFKVCEYKDEKVAPEDWSGYGQVDKDAPDSAATKGQIVQGDDDDIKVAEGCDGVYTIYYHHTGYATNKVYIPCLYVVTWKNYDNTVLATENYAYTATASYKGETPTKPADSSYTYSFTGWDPTPGSVLADTTYTAQFSNTPVDYSITYQTGYAFKSTFPTTYNCDSATIILPTESDFATKPEDCRFAGWYTNDEGTGDRILSIPSGSTGDKVFYEKWEEKVVLTYVDDSGSRTVSGFAGETVTAPEVTPRGGYSASWAKTVSVFPSADETIEANYSKNTYNISFNAGDGATGGSVNPATYQISNVDQTVTITAPTKDGSTPSYKIVPAADYSGIDPTVSGTTITIPANSYGDFGVVTSWTENNPTVTINIVGDSYGSVTVDGEAYTDPITVPLNSEYMVVGDSILIDEVEIVATAKEATSDYTYLFDGWSNIGESGTITSDIAITATFSQHANPVITIGSCSGGSIKVDDEIVSSVKVPYGSEVTIVESLIEISNEDLGFEANIEAIPSSDAQYTREFEAWDGISEGTITSNTTLTASFTETLNEYTITFKNDDGTVLQSGKVAYGQTPVYSGSTPTKAATAQYTYTFDDWDKTIVSVTGDATYTATYTQTVNEYTITFKNDDGTVLQSGKVAYGSVPSYTGETPTKPATDDYTYTFAGWDKQLVEVTGAATYTATFNEVLTSLGKAKQFADFYLTEIEKVCILEEDEKGDIEVKTVLSDLQAKWSVLEAKYDEIIGDDVDAQNYLKNASPVSESTNSLEKFASSYDYVYWKYGASLGSYGGNFAERNVKAQSGSRLLSINNVSTSTWIIAAVAIIGIAAVGVFFIYKKRKEI